MSRRYREKVKAKQRVTQERKARMLPPYSCPRCGLKHFYPTRLRDGMTIGTCRECWLEVKAETGVDLIDDYNRLVDKYAKLAA